MKDHKNSYIKGANVATNFMIQSAFIFRDEEDFCARCYAAGVAIELLAIVTLLREDEEQFIEAIFETLKMRLEEKREGHDSPPVGSDMRMN
jgi:hypothetical protein